jgi:cyclopropane fatty-acyl-phospholipid synthase-like methyltransferase
MFDTRSILSFPPMYKLFARSIGASHCRHFLAEKCIRAKVGDRILDIGCGPGDILEYLQDVDYLGFDMSPEYIYAAKKRFGNKGQFFCDLVTKNTVKENSTFDIVIALGILHHLNDNKALELFDLAWKALKLGGRLITFDGCYMKNQSPLTRFILSKDRGQYVRTEQEYLRLTNQIFPSVKTTISNNLLRIPYTHIILECTKAPF